VRRILAISLGGLVISILLILLGFQQEGSQGTPVKIDLTKIKTYPAKVIRVYDGDTIKIDNGESVRYIGIDTPETHHPYRPVEFLGKEATEVNKNLVGGKKVYLELDIQKRDKYGRLLAYIFLPDGTFVNAELARLGYAYTMTIPPNVKYTELFRKVAREAREKKRGLWQKTETIGMDEASKYLGKVKTVRCKIINTYDSGKVVFLNTGKDYKRDFTVAIFHGALDNFPFNPLTYYKGKQIEVTGKLQEYWGPEIIIEDPTQIRIIK
jgi:micrococcal nuclease